jgi:hypothetical protein
MRIKHLYILICLSVFCSAFMQKEETSNLAIKVKFDFFTTDNLGNIYTVKEDELFKYLPNGKMFARYSNLKLGSITYVDATNPLKIILYYRDFQQIVFLDNQLSVNSDAVSLERLGYEQTDLVCASANNSFWIYNKQNNELHRFNENSKKIYSTGNLKQILRNNISPNYMMEYNGFLYLNSPEAGIYVFDIFGAFSRIISIQNLTQFQVNENIIYYQKDSSFCSYNYVLFEDACKNLPNLSKALGVRFNAQKIYTGFRDSLTIKVLE